MLQSLLISEFQYSIALFHIIDPPQLILTVIRSCWLRDLKAACAGVHWFRSWMVRTSERYIWEKVLNSVSVFQSYFPTGGWSLKTSASLWKCDSSKPSQVIPVCRGSVVVVICGPLGPGPVVNQNRFCGGTGSFLLENSHTHTHTHTRVTISASTSLLN